MPDPFRKVVQGDAVSFSATVENAKLGAAKEWLESQHDKKASVDPVVRQGDVVRIKNFTGGHLPRNSVIGLSGPIFKPSQNLDAFLREVTFIGVVPSSAHKGKFGVTLDTIRSEGIGRCYVDGVVQVLVDVNSGSHKCADVLPGSVEHLSSSKDGSASILWKESDSESYAYDTGVQWAIVRFGAGCAGSSGSGSINSRCDCPDESYTVEVTCGECGSYYADAIMPKIWWIEIIGATTPPYGSGYGYCENVGCEELYGQRFKLEHQSAYGYGDCTWEGAAGNCIHAELTVDGDDWKITLLDKDDCVVAVLRKPFSEFNCCGENRNWESDQLGACILDIILSPDPCTCCPDTLVTCPPDGEVVCPDTDCCIEACACEFTVTVTNLFTPVPLVCDFGATDCLKGDGVTPCSFPEADCWRGETVAIEKRCGGMNGAYPMKWAGPCLWLFEGEPGGGGVKTRVRSRLTLSGRLWKFEVLGADGQTAFFESEDWDCTDLVTLHYKGGTCPQEAYPEEPAAEFNLCLQIN